MFEKVSASGEGKRYIITLALLCIVLMGVVVLQQYRLASFTIDCNEHWQKETVSCQTVGKFSPWTFNITGAKP